MREMMMQYVTGEGAKIFEQIHVPGVSVGGGLWPVNYEGDRRHLHPFQAIVLKKADHFLMMDLPEAFNQALEKAIRMLPGNRGNETNRADRPGGAAVPGQ
jgi:hypothetical protein